MFSFKKLVPLSIFFKIKRALVQLDKNTPEFSFKVEQLYSLSRNQFFTNEENLKKTFKKIITEPNSNGKICMLESISCFSNKQAYLFFLLRS